tara:strand:+ start:171 stop:302 length:132 start_codon:yes stop_codon:yes gene_type:complete
MGKEKKKKKIKLPNDWWISDLSVELDNIEHTYFINREIRRVRS